jgi:hypothetical protein
LRFPGIALWIPHGEGTIGHGIHHQAGIHGAASRTDPRFLFEIEASVVGLGLIRIVFTIHPEADFSRLSAVNRHAESPHCRHEKVLTPRGRFSLCFDHGLGHCLGLFNSPKLFAMRH